jgi:hypothetical protein
VNCRQSVVRLSSMVMRPGNNEVECHLAFMTPKRDHGPVLSTRMIEMAAAEGNGTAPICSKMAESIEVQSVA